MAKQRSPNYPGLSLQKAIQRASLVYKAEHTHPTPKEVVAKHLGYTSLNGSSLTAIGALNHYGLLEPAGDGLRVTSDAVAILELPEGDVERIEATYRCAFRPQLFADLSEQFGSKLPSEANLRHALIKQGFIPKAADEVIRVYRENLEILGNGENECNGPVEEDMRQNPTAGPETLGRAFSKEIERGTPVAEALKHVGEKWAAPLLTQSLVISIPRNMKVEISVRGDEIKKEDLLKIKSQFNRWIEGLEEAFEE
jgi:hypothetical protein